MSLKNSENIIVYHGGIDIIRTIDLTQSRANVDFGVGFYTTSSLYQATRWSKTTARRRKIQKAYINKYLIEHFQGLEVLEFDSADANWFQYVIENRNGNCVDSATDIVAGPVADDDTTIVFQAYTAGLYGSDEQAICKAIQFLEVGNLKNQICFRSLKAVNQLKWIGADEVWLQNSK
jgi:hypothetical protein